MKKEHEVRETNKGN